LGVPLSRFARNATGGRRCRECDGQGRLAVEHRTGVLQIGDAAVVIAASAEHRVETFAATRAMIDRLKEQAPIWKEEVGPDGSEWVGLGP
jgi:molybdopterin synthase catalytic subunit